MIGKGSFGKVMQVRKRDTGRIYALKTLRKALIVSRSEITHTLAERLVLGRVSCPFIVPLKFSFQSEQKLYLVLAYVSIVVNSLGLPTNNCTQALSMVANFSITSKLKGGSTKSAVGSTLPNSC